MKSGDIYIGERVNSEQHVAELARKLNEDKWGDLSDQEILDRLGEDNIICSVETPFALIGEKEYQPIEYDPMNKTVNLVIRAHLADNFPLDSGKDTGGIVGVKITSQFVPFLLDATEEGTQYGRPNPFLLDFDAARRIQNQVRQTFRWFEAGTYLMDTNYS